MKVARIMMLIAALALAMGSLAHGDDAVKQEKKADAPKELKPQTHCPVMGGVIDSTQYTDIQGQRVYHCCGMCSAKLKADPDKYFKQAAEQGILFENIQTTCPVSGKKLGENKVYRDWEGRRIYFCCDMCPPKFMAEPQKYLGNLEPVQKGDKAETAKPATDEKMPAMHDMKGSNN